MDDFIRRREVIDILCKLHIDNIAVNDKKITEYVREIPKVDAVPVVHGEWKETKYYTWKCSVCGFHPFKGYIPKEPNFNFCPNCGAKMEKLELVVPEEALKEAILKMLDQEQKEKYFFGK